MKKNAIALLVTFCMMPLWLGCATPQFQADADSLSPVTHELVKTTQSWDGADLPAYPEGQPEITILRIKIPAGARLATHHHPVINAGVLTRGQLTVVTLDGQTLHLKADDPIVEVVGTPHYGINEGQEPAEIIVFYAGIEDKPITVIEPRGFYRVRER